MQISTQKYILINCKASRLGGLYKQILSRKILAINSLNTGLQSLNTGLQSLNTGLQSLNTGLQSLNTGLQPLKAGLQSLNTGLQPLNTGLQPLNIGLHSLNIRKYIIKINLKIRNHGKKEKRLHTSSRRHVVGVYYKESCLSLLVAIIYAKQVIPRICQETNIL